MQNRNKGITLIALIITIIVMLILVAVSVNILIKSNLIGTAEKTVNKYKSASEEESKGGVIEIDGKKYNSIEDHINNKPLSTIKIKMEVTHEDTTIPTDETKYTLTSENVPIPEGYYYVGGTKNTGVVISDNENDKNKGDAHSVSATLQGNQFVWVPVLQNQKIKIEITAEEDLTEIKIEDPLGTAITKNAENKDITVSGKTNTIIINPTTNGEYTLTVKTANDENTEILYVKSLYAQDITSMRDVFLAMIQKQVKEQNVTEDEAAKELTNGQCNTVAEMVTVIKQLMQQYTDSDISTHEDSVNKYGGFYIARYEAGSENKRTSSSGTTDVVLSQANKYPYNYISQADSIIKAATINNGKTNVTASLINGAVWDRTLNWLEETKAVTRTELFDSTSWGNHKNSQFNFTGKYSTDYGANFTDVTTSTQKPENEKYLLGTGVTEYTKKNNIYDLAGNCWEWTTESSSSSDRVLRGRQVHPLWFQRYSVQSWQHFSRQRRRHFFPFCTLRSTVSLYAIH